MRSTGKIHLGNYFGAVRNWVDLQDRYDCYYFVADWHALTSDYADPSKIAQSTFDAVADWLAAGLDPAKSTIFIQSRGQGARRAAPAAVDGHAAAVAGARADVQGSAGSRSKTRTSTPTASSATRCCRPPTSSSIAANFVPVGEDQASHLEISREIVRRFNNFYGDVFPEPQALFTETPKVPGLDGRKMSKSYSNTIGLTASADEIRALVHDDVHRPASASAARIRAGPTSATSSSSTSSSRTTRRSRASITSAARRRSAASTTRSCWPRS